VKVLAALLLLVAGSAVAARGRVAAETDFVLVGSDAETGRAAFCRRFPAGGFALAFDHSMYGGEVRERFVAAGGSLRRIETTTANLAAAEYYAYDGAVVRQGERFRVEAPTLDLPAVVVRVDRVGRHRLLIGGERLDLLPLVGDRRPLRLALAAGAGCLG